jgi:hypothetical protein
MGEKGGVVCVLYVCRKQAPRRKLDADVPQAGA